MTKLPKLYYISQGANLEDHLAGIEKVSAAGCKMVQLRLKGYSETQVENTALLAHSICKKYNSQLIINDYHMIAEKMEGVGLHLGQKDTPISNVKRTLACPLIGGTANTLQDCIDLTKNEVDYIGLGPFQFTETKLNLDPILGINGYKDILAKIKSLKISTPIYAIGGIDSTDIPKLLDIGLSGIAVSSLFANKTETEIKKMIDLYE